MVFGHVNVIENQLEDILGRLLGGKSWEPKLPLADNIIDPLTHINAQQGAISAH